MPRTAECAWEDAARRGCCWSPLARLLGALAAACGCGLLLISGCVRQPTGGERSLFELFPVGTAARTETVDESWIAAESPRSFVFPDDHAAHEDYRIEWWYYTGNLEAPDGRRFGYQLTFFRTGLHKQPDNPSPWAVRDLYTAHFAVSDIRRQQHHCFQRNSRRGIGQAGAQPDRYEVWNGGWKAWLEGDAHRIRAEDGDVAIDLTLVPAKPTALHGERGLSQKGPTVGNASYYYSITRLETTGTVCIGDQTLTVQGDSWMDHEFSTSFLEPGQLGWDWFAIQLDDGVDLMLYRMRREDGSTDPFSSGSLINQAGELDHLSIADYAMEPLEYWQSRATGAKYPVRWRIRIPSRGYELEITAAFSSQEMTTADTTGISYWEGAIEVAGEDRQRKVSGRGYMELTGYVGSGLGSLLK